jgi:N-acylneuraminate cytidylyltransferase
MKNIAIIPARGGSKGIPNKNIKLVNGKPLVAWSIEQALNSKYIDDVYVSSDSKQILDISIEYGAKGIIRPKAISDDLASSESAWIHTILELEKRNVFPKLIIGIQATSPLRHSSDFDEAIQQFYDKELDSLFTSNLIEDFHVWENVNTTNPKVNYDYNNRQRRQNITPKYLENGSFYLFTPNGIKETNNRLHGLIGTYVQDKYKFAQIDDTVDIEICSALIEKFLNA